MSKIRKNVNYSYLCGGNVADFFYGRSSISGAMARRKNLSEKKFSGRCSKSAIRTFYEMNLTFKNEMNRILATTLLAALAFTACMKDKHEE